jgi:transcriptional regulator with PAS, ATPase and Fis domain
MIQLAINTPHDLIQPIDLPDEIRNPTKVSGFLSLEEKLEKLGKESILESLTKTNGNQSAAAKLLGLTEGGLRAKMKKYRLTSASR